MSNSMYPNQNRSPDIYEAVVETTKGTTTVGPNYITATRQDDRQAFVTAVYTNTVSTPTYTSGTVPVLYALPGTTQFPSQQYSPLEFNLSQQSNGPITYTFSSPSPLQNYNPNYSYAKNFTNSYFPTNSIGNYALPDNFIGNGPFLYPPLTEPINGFDQNQNQCCCGSQGSCLPTPMSIDQQTESDQENKQYHNKSIEQSTSTTDLHLTADTFLMNGSFRPTAASTPIPQSAMRVCLPQKTDPHIDQTPDRYSNPPQSIHHHESPCQHFSYPSPEETVSYQPQGLLAESATPKPDTGPLEQTTIEVSDEPLCVRLFTTDESSQTLKQAGADKCSETEPGHESENSHYIIVTEEKAVNTSNEPSEAVNQTQIEITQTDQNKHVVFETYLPKKNDNINYEAETSKNQKNVFDTVDEQPHSILRTGSKTSSDPNNETYVSTLNINFGNCSTTENIPKK